MPPLSTRIREIGHTQAIREALFGDENPNRKCIEYYLRTYEGKSPYFGFILKNVPRTNLSLFMARGLDYEPFDSELLKIKAMLPPEE